MRIVTISLGILQSPKFLDTFASIIEIALKSTSNVRIVTLVRKAPNVQAQVGDVEYSVAGNEASGGQKSGIRQMSPSQKNIFKQDNIEKIPNQRRKNKNYYFYYLRKNDDQHSYHFLKGDYGI